MSLVRAVVAAVALTALTLPWPSRTDSQTLTPLTVTFVPVSDAVPLKYAVAEHLFEKAGLDVKIVQVGTGALATVAVVGGAADIGSANSLAITVARSKGVPLMMVAPQAQYDDRSPTTQVLVEADSSIKGPRDLEGKTVAVAGLHDLLNLGVTAWMTRGGADPTKAHFVEMAQPSMLASLDAKRVDAIAVSEPALTAATATGHVRMLAAPYDAIAKRFIVDNYFATSEWLATHRDVALRFADVMRQATAYTNSHYDAMLPMIASYTSITPDVLQKMHQIKGAPALTADEIQPIIDAAAKYGVIASPFPAGDMIFSEQTHFP